jgi:AcrR family transcriptional regulator
VSTAGLPGVDAPVRDIAAEAGVGMGTIYRHFPTRADLVVLPVLDQLLKASAAAGHTRADISMIDLLLAGLAQAGPVPTGSEPEWRPRYPQGCAGPCLPIGTRALRMPDLPEPS